MDIVNIRQLNLAQISQIYHRNILQKFLCYPSKIRQARMNGSGSQSLLVIGYWGVGCSILRTVTKGKEPFMLPLWQKNRPILIEYPTRNIQYPMTIGSGSQASIDIGYWILGVAYSALQENKKPLAQLRVLVFSWPKKWGPICALSEQTGNI